jgi:hypothetical protein
MQRAIFLIALLGYPATECAAQTRVDLSSQSKSVDFSAAAFTLPVRTGPSLAANCKTGELFYKTNAPAGQNLYGCTSTNVWTLQSGGSGGTGGGGGGAVSSVAGKIGDVRLQATDLMDFKVDLSNGALSVGSGCTASLPCTIRFGSKTYLVPDAASITNLTGTGSAGPHTVYIYIRADGVLYFGVDGNSVSGATLVNAVLSVGTTNFPADSYALASCLVSNSVVTQCTDLRGAGRDVVAAADGTLQVINNPTTGYQEIAVNPSSVATSGGSNDLSGNNKVNLGSQYLSITLSNDSTAGTVQNRFVALGVAGTAVLPGTSANGRIVGVCMAGCGNTGNARIATRGQVLVQFDGPTTAGNYVKLSAQTAGKASDAGTNRPTSGQILGYVLTTNSAAGTYNVVLEPDVFAFLPERLRKLFEERYRMFESSSGNFSNIDTVRVRVALLDQFSERISQSNNKSTLFTGKNDQSEDTYVAAI